MLGAWKEDTEYEVAAALRLMQCAKRGYLNKGLPGLTGKRASLAIVTSSAVSFATLGEPLETGCVSLETQYCADS